MTHVAFLSSAQVFGSLNEEQLKAIDPFCMEKAFSKGKRIFSEGENADHIWCVKEGQVDLRFDLPGRKSSKENTISMRMEKMIFGWSSLVPPYQYRLSAYCASDVCKVICAEKKCLIQLFDRDKIAGYKFMSSLIEVVGMRFHQLQEKGGFYD